MFSSTRKCLSFRRLLALESCSSFSSHRHRCSSPLSILPSPFLLEASKAPELSSATVTTAHRVFCSRSSNLKDAQLGPAAIDYSSILEEDEFHRLADGTIHDLQEKLEEYGDDVQIDGFDIDYANQVLTLKLGNLGTYVLNKQTPNRQIWLSSPVSGPSRFDWDRSSQSWIYRRTKANLLQLLESELEQLCGPNTTLIAPLKDAKGVNTSYPHRKLTLFHTLPVDATAAITLAAGGSEGVKLRFAASFLHVAAINCLSIDSSNDVFV